MTKKPTVAMDAAALRAKEMADTPADKVAPEFAGPAVATPPAPADVKLAEDGVTVYVVNLLGQRHNCIGVYRTEADAQEAMAKLAEKHRAKASVMAFVVGDDPDEEWLG